MANELLVMPRKFNQPVIGDKLMTQGGHVRSGTDNRVDMGNSDSYVVTRGVEYLHLVATAPIWVRMSENGANAEAGKDQYMGTDDTLEIYDLELADGTRRRIQEGDVLKCVTN